MYFIFILHFLTIFDTQGLSYVTDFVQKFNLVFIISSKFIMIMDWITHKGKERGIYNLNISDLPSKI